MRFYSCNPWITALYLVKLSIKMDPDANLRTKNFKIHFYDRLLYWIQKV